MNKGLIFDIRRFTVHDGPGIRTTIFFKGCPLSCWWCHNPESQACQPEESTKTVTLDGKTFRQPEITGKLMSTGEVMDEVKRDRIFYSESGGGVTFSGGEPLNQPEFLIDLMKECRKENFHTVLDTTGYADPETIRMILPWTDLFLYDLKLMDKADHIKYTGVSNKSILENLSFLITGNQPVVIRIPVVPGITDTAKNIREIKSFLAMYKSAGNNASKLKLSLLPYHSIAKNKYERFQIENRLKELKDVQKESLLPLRKEFEEAGYPVTI